METEWVMDRVQLYRLMRREPSVVDPALGERFGAQRQLGQEMAQAAASRPAAHLAGILEPIAGAETPAPTGDPTGV